jgi:hypothetical protein
MQDLPDAPALRGNDVGSVMLEENVVKAAGVNNCTTEEGLRRIIRDAGFMLIGSYDEPVSSSRPAAEKA